MIVSLVATDVTRNDTAKRGDVQQSIDKLSQNFLQRPVALFLAIHRQALLGA